MKDRQAALRFITFPLIRGLWSIVALHLSRIEMGDTPTRNCDLTGVMRTPNATLAVTSYLTTNGDMAFITIISGLHSIALDCNGLHPITYH